MPFISDYTVEILFLPYAACSAHQQHMNVIRHNHKSQYMVFSPVHEENSIGNYLTYTRVFKNTSAITIVE